MYVAPSANAEVVRQAAIEVVRANQTEAPRAVEQTKAQAQFYVTNAQAEASTKVANVQVEAVQALTQQESRLRQTFEERERERATAKDQ